MERADEDRARELVGSGRLGSGSNEAARWTRSRVQEDAAFAQGVVEHRALDVPWGVRGAEGTTLAISRPGRRGLLLVLHQLPVPLDRGG